MGLFSKLKDVLNPISTKNPIANPGGYLVGKALGVDKQESPAAAVTQETYSQPQYDPNLVYGNPGDESYGSFTDPFTVEDFYDYQDPGYAFELQQGTQALQNSAASKSGALSGAALKDLLGYSQDFARTGYNDAFNRYQTQQGNIFSRLSSIAQLGQNASAGVGSTGAGIVGNAGQNVSNAGGAAGAGIVGAGNAIGGGLSDYWLWKNYGGAGSPMAGSNYSPTASYRVS
jgi:hypothetical protein